MKNKKKFIHSIAHAWRYGPSLQRISRDFPTTTFVYGPDVSTSGLINVHVYNAAAEQGGYVNSLTLNNEGLGVVYHSDYSLSPRIRTAGDEAAREIRDGTIQAFS